MQHKTLTMELKCTHLKNAFAGWVEGCAFKEDRGCPVQHRPIRHVSVSCDPTNVSSAPVHVVFLKKNIEMMQIKQGNH